MASETDALKALASRVREGGVVVFTGAGMSTDSGLPDFRSAKGLWNKVDPMELATASAMRKEYGRFCEFYSYRLEQMLEAVPNRGHLLLADWEERGFVRTVITQNIDGLHRAAGTKSLQELHGTIGLVRCMDCSRAFTPQDFINRTLCSCGGRLRPGVVLFGENLNESVLDVSWRAAEQANVFIVLGSSLRVSPANALPMIAKRVGAALAICNRERTHLDGMADLVYEGGIAEFLLLIDDEIRQQENH